MTYYDLDGLELKHPKCFLTTIIVGIFIEITLIVYYL